MGQKFADRLQEKRQPMIGDIQEKDPYRCWWFSSRDSRKCSPNGSQSRSEALLSIADAHDHRHGTNRLAHVHWDQHRSSHERWSRSLTYKLKNNNNRSSVNKRVLTWTVEILFFPFAVLGCRCVFASDRRETCDEHQDGHIYRRLHLKSKNLSCRYFTETRNPKVYSC